MASALTKRIASAVVIAPIFIGAIILGGIPLAIWLLIAFAISVYEWFGLAKKIPPYYLQIMAVGVVYMALSYSSFLALREVYSINLLLMFIGMIWISDIGAYAVGKTFGGPKLIVEISPNKTWSGFVGALLFPALFGGIWTVVIGFDSEFNDNPWYIMMLICSILGIVMGTVGQAGDLLVSYLKRRAKVKDTGALIPGHGGILDRIDSMLLGAPVFFIIITLLSYVF